MFRVTIKCKTEYLRETRYLITGTTDVEEAKNRAVERWNQEEKIHSECEADIFEVLSLTDTITGCWRLAN